MRQGSFGNARVYLDNKEIPYTNISYNHSGRNTAAKMIVSIPDPQIQNSKIFGATLKVFLNLGANDNVPFFRGTIHQMSPTETDLKITAFDALNYLAGDNTTTFNLTDKDNFDGMTVAQFLRFYTDTYINANKVRVGTNLLNETKPVKTLTGLRGTFTPLSIIDRLLKYDDSDISDVRAVRLGVRDSGDKTNFCFFKEQKLTDSGIIFTLNDGIQSYKYKKNKVPNTVTGVVDKRQYTYKHNNLTSDIASVKLKGNFKYPDEFKTEAISFINYLENKREISINVSKGYYLSVGNVIKVIIRDQTNDIEGKFRIVSKKITISGSGMSCTFGLDKSQPIISDYI
jgi:hypothetical protein